MGKDYQIINDEAMYSYFHELKNGKLDFLGKIGNSNGKEKVWQRSLTSYNFEQIYETRQAVYSEEEVCNELCMMDDILHIFQTYFWIPGIDRLLVNNYGALENDIFLEYDGNTGMPKKIREHYKHQYRNAYLGSILLLDYDFLDAMTQCILESNSIFASYIKALIGLEEKSIRRVLYLGYFISAMFHDIGYPLDFFMRKVRQIHQYVPFYKIISSNVKTEFVELKASLAGSLLFELIDAEMIEEKYHRNDHGCLSAISFLLNFYTSGSIFALDDDERCVIEISALAIYKHTDRLKNDFMIFEEDPLSYMVRLCDDLQEWERLLLVINEKHNYLKCAECGSVIRPKGRQYQCDCGVRYEKITDITNKKVNYISLCNELRLCYDREKRMLEIELEFDDYKQIEILMDDYCAVKKRKEELKKVRNYLSFQKYIPSVCLKDNLSNNPLLLINHFLDKHGLNLEKLRQELRSSSTWNEYGTEKFMEFLDKVEFYLVDMEGELKETFGEEIESDVLVCGENAAEFVEKYLGQIHTVMKSRRV